MISPGVNFQWNMEYVIIAVRNKLLKYVQTRD